MISEEAIEEFKALYLKTYGIELSNKEASFRANNLVDLYSAVYGNAEGLMEKKSIKEKNNI